MKKFKMRLFENDKNHIPNDFLPAEILNTNKILKIEDFDDIIQLKYDKILKIWTFKNDIHKQFIGPFDFEKYDNWFKDQMKNDERFVREKKNKYVYYTLPKEVYIEYLDEMNN